MTRATASLAMAMIAVGLSACSTVAVQPADRTMPAALREAPERFVVVTVHDKPSRKAAGNHRGFAAYGPSSRARATAAAIAADYAIEEAASWPISLIGVHCIVYAMPPSAAPDDLLQRLAADRRVESAQPLATFSTRTSAYNDPYAGLQDSLEQMSVAEAQQWSRGGGVRVAVVDTGVDLHHPDLQGRIAGHRNFVDADERAFESDMHGTAVAGVIAALANNRIGIAGIAPEAELFVYKACWRNPAQAGTALCNSFTLAQAIAAAIGARADVVNLSLAGPPDPLLARIVTQGVRKGIVFVGAAAPEGAREGFPGDVPGVVMVDAPQRRYGVAANVVAPGRDVLTLVPGAHYDFASGSSLAAAQATGVVALLLAAEPRLRGVEIAHLLQRTSQPVESTAGSFAAINACAALVAVRKQGNCQLQGAANFARRGVESKEAMQLEEP